VTAPVDASDRLWLFDESIADELLAFTEKEGSSYRPPGAQDKTTFARDSSFTSNDINAGDL
jgi:hypothetical protein